MVSSALLYTNCCMLLELLPLNKILSVQAGFLVFSTCCFVAGLSEVDTALGLLMKFSIAVESLNMLRSGMDDPDTLTESSSSPAGSNDSEMNFKTQSASNRAFQSGRLLRTKVLQRPSFNFECWSERNAPFHPAIKCTTSSPHECEFLTVNQPVKTPVAHCQPHLCITQSNAVIQISHPHQNIMI